MTVFLHFVALMSETSEPTHETQVEITAEATLVRPRREEDHPPPSGALLSRQMRKIEEMESTLQSHVAKLEERRAQLEQQKMALDAQKTADDEVDKFGLMVASLLRKIPEELRPETMFEVHKVMYEKLQKAKQTAGQQVS
ncbi:uncharacterized protein LOC134454586 isoform X2 [Engraulis encrasicolus]|uniref:uncharacterized protein LOC134454586 isoform X2 n=1 Tax=Engraulis encrasicolus TaxID=184585 RepID=UPI002FD0D642